MPDSLANVRAALAAMSDNELAALHVVADTIVVTAVDAGVMAAIAHTADWELHRRRGIDFALWGPLEAIGPRISLQASQRSPCSVDSFARSRACKRCSTRSA